MESLNSTAGRWHRDQSQGGGWGCPSPRRPSIQVTDSPGPGLSQCVQSQHTRACSSKVKFTFYLSEADFLTQDTRLVAGYHPGQPEKDRSHSGGSVKGRAHLSERNGTRPHTPGAEVTLPAQAARTTLPRIPEGCGENSLLQRKLFLHTEDSQTTFPTFPNRKDGLSAPPAAEVILSSQGWEGHELHFPEFSESLPSPSGSAME